MLICVHFKSNPWFDFLIWKTIMYQCNNWWFIVIVLLLLMIMILKSNQSWYWQSLQQAVWRDYSAPQNQDAEEELSGTSRPFMKMIMTMRTIMKMMMRTIMIMGGGGRSSITKLFPVPLLTKFHHPTGRQLVQRKNS